MEVDYLSILAKTCKSEFEENRPILLEGDYYRNHNDWSHYCISSNPKTYLAFSKSWLSEWSNVDEMNLIFGAMFRSQYLETYVDWLTYEKRILTLKELDAIVHNIRLCKIKEDFEEAREYVLSYLGGCKYYNEGQLWSV